MSHDDGTRISPASVLELADLVAAVTDEDGVVTWLSPAATRFMRAAFHFDVGVGTDLRSAPPPFAELIDQLLDRVQGHPGERAVLEYELTESPCRLVRRLEVENRADDPAVEGLLWYLHPVGAGDPDLEIAIARLASMERVLDRVRRVIDHVAEASLRPFAVDAQAAVSNLPGAATLTDREREIARMLAEGFRIASVARRLHLSQSAVRNHLSTIYRKVGVSDQAGLLHRLRSAAQAT